MKRLPDGRRSNLKLALSNAPHEIVKSSLCQAIVNQHAILLSDAVRPILRLYASCL